MGVKLCAFLPVAAIFMTAATAQAGAAAVPAIDLQRRCHDTQAAVAQMVIGTLGDIFETCIKSEGAAREQLANDWSAISATDKALCVQPKAYSPSYVEWLACVELMRDVKRQRQQNPVALRPANACPRVNWTISGSVSSVVACNSSWGSR